MSYSSDVSDVFDSSDVSDSSDASDASDASDPLRLPLSTKNKLTPRVACTLGVSLYKR